MHATVVERGDPDEDAYGLPRQLVSDLSPILQRLPRDFEQKPLLRVHSNGFTRRDTEERGIEAVDPWQEDAEARAHLSRCRRIVVVERALRPAIGRDFGDGIHAVFQELPELVRPVGSGKPTSDADNRYGFHFGTFLSSDDASPRCFASAETVG